METMKIHITKEHSFLRTIFLHLSGPIEQIYTNNKMSYVFNLGLITLLHTAVYPWVALIFKISLIFMNMQMKKNSYRTTGWKTLSNCTTDYMKRKTCNIGGLKMFFGLKYMFNYIFLWF